MKTVIVEDQLPTRQFLEEILTDHCHGVSIVVRTATVKSTEELILKHQPDLTISDVKLGEQSSFELLKSLALQGFRRKVVFIMAYERLRFTSF